MKLQRSTVILVAAALLLGGVVLLTQSQQSPPNGSTAGQNDSETSPVYDFAEADVVVLQIETSGQTVAFEKDDEDFWQMVEPDEQPAEEAAIAFLLSRLVTDGLLNTTTIDAAEQADFGFDDPFATVTLTLTDGTTHILIVGDADFSGQNYYALLDPEAFPLAADAGDIEVAIVTQNIVNGVDRPLEEWQAVLETPLEETEETEVDEADAEETEAIDSEDDALDVSPDQDSEVVEESGTNSEEPDSDPENSDTTNDEEGTSSP
ncbi:MAG: DUF4340 domain-containing protein [Leptolyngbya sp. SIOISBB]|nr:DUF4340 domain-containing protein [Leptolyngbya sp. SIOISBB]